MGFCCYFLEYGPMRKCSEIGLENPLGLCNYGMSDEVWMVSLFRGMGRLIANSF